MAKKEPTPNYDIMFECAVSALQFTFSEYKKAKKKDMDNTFITADGYIGVLDGYDKRVQKIEALRQEVQRQMQEVERLRELKGGEDK
ncbi:MAG: hypothetical protein LIR46_00640 [Bacteroidota bacterium]|nr:hypothetical protein [Bacteroidota bacterium]